MLAARFWRVDCRGAYVVSVAPRTVYAALVYAARWSRVVTLGLALVAAQLCATNASARERSYFFERVNAEDDLAQNTVNAILQDADGFLWVGTQGGLHRYDGYRFTLFQHNPQDPGSLPDSFVTALAQDAQGRLWVGMNGSGIAWFDAAGARFVADDGENTLSSQKRGAVGALLADEAHGLWIGSRLGVELRTPTGQRRDVLVFDGERARPGEVRGLARGSDGSVWAATTAGLYRIDGETLRAELVALPADEAHAVFVDRDGGLWVGTEAGLFRRELSGAFVRAWPAQPGNERSAVYDIEQVADGRLWLAVYGGGVIVHDAAKDTHEALRHNREIPGTLPEDSIRTLAIDRSGLLWIGGDVFGLARVDPAGAKFAYLVDDNRERPVVDTNNIRSLYEDDEARLWIGTEGDGPKRYDRVSDSYEYYLDVLRDALPAPRRNIAMRTFSILPDGFGQLWVATNVGVFLLDPEKRQATALPVDPTRTDALPDPTVRSMIAGRDGSLWMGTFTRGLVRYQPRVARWTYYRSAPVDTASLWHNAVLTLREDRSGRIWIGTLDGLNLLDPANDTMRRIPRASPASDSLAGNIVRAIHEASDGTLWIGSHNGLSRLDELTPTGARFSRYLASDGLPGSSVYGILEDDRGMLWLSTNRGVARFDPARREFRRYTLADGLQGLEFNGGAQLRLHDGRLAFGGSRGINWFTPERMSPSEYEPRLAFTSFVKGDRRTAVYAPEAFGALAIDSSARVVGFEFAALDFAAPTRNLYEYRLDGFDDEWLALGSRHDVTFTNLDAGTYALRVRGSNRDGRWSSQELRLDLTVRPSWWASRTMQIAYALAALLLVALAIVSSRRRVHRDRQHTRELREREERLRVAIWGSGDEFWDWDIRRGLLYRVGADSLLGYEHEHKVTGDEWRRRSVHPEDLPRVEQILAAHVSGEREFFESEHRVLNSRGEWVWVLSRGKIVERDDAGQPMRIAGTARDISHTREVEREKRIAEEVIRSMSEAVVVTDLEFKFASINPAFTRMTGYSDAEVANQPTSILDCEQHTPEFHQALRNTLVKTGHWSGEIWQRRKDGEEFLCWLELSEVSDRHGLRTHWVGVLSDITDRKRAEQELRYLANYDTLTGLPNRSLLGERLAHALIRARRHGSKVGVLFLDLDRFKHVNDSLGHAAGDRLLKAAAARIQASVRDSDTVARLGGDEFTVIIEDLVDQPQAERVAQKLIDSFVLPLDIDGRTEIVISPSIGISIYPDHGQVPTDLLKFADTAMYQAKDRGRNTYQTYTEAMDAHARLRASMVSHLHKAIERGEFSLVYQPKMSLVDGRITGCEALLRWRNPDLGSVSPATFIPLAEETGLIVPIGEWVLREACVQIQRWMRNGLTSTTMAVNVSMLQLLRGELYTLLRQLLEDFRIPAHRLALELTESMVMANAEQSISTLTQIKSLGVGVAIDDFGTGYSSLAYLKRLPIDTLKIDKEFVGDITTDPDDEAITATVITMAHSLGLDVIAEGVETPEQLDYLREQRCDEAQGNLISHPLDPDRCLKFLLERRNAQEPRRESRLETRGDVREFPSGGKR
jgi:diguanylate cyclase (GGDEF)-like protein/PAS domain S-box-containing protein